MAVAGYIAYNFVIGAYSYWGPKAGYNIYHMVSSLCTTSNRYVEGGYASMLLCGEISQFVMR